MRVTLAEVAPVRGDVEPNLALLRGVLKRAEGSDLVALPELFLTGYANGDRVHRLALDLSSELGRRLIAMVKGQGAWVALGTPLRHRTRTGETENAVILISPRGDVHVQSKRYLPTFGPFEEGQHYSPGLSSDPVVTPFGKVGLQICYDAFFPEVSRELLLKGAQFLLIVSASPVTSRPLFEKVLAGRAVENGCPVAYVNRVGVEDGLVFAGGSGIWDPRGEPLTPDVVGLKGEDRLLNFDLTLEDSARWRPMRPVIRDLASRLPS